MVALAVNSDDFLPSALDTSDARMDIMNGRATVVSKELPSITKSRKLSHASALLETLARRTMLDIYPTLAFQKPVGVPVGASQRNEQVRATLDLLSASYGPLLFSHIYRSSGT